MVKCNTAYHDDPVGKVAAENDEWEDGEEDDGPHIGNGFARKLHHFNRDPSVWRLERVRITLGTLGNGQDLFSQEEQHEREDCGQADHDGAECAHALLHIERHAANRPSVSSQIEQRKRLTQRSSSDWSPCN